MKRRQAGRRTLELNHGSVSRDGGNACHHPADEGLARKVMRSPPDLDTTLLVGNLLGLRSSRRADTAARSDSQPPSKTDDL